MFAEIRRQFGDVLAIVSARWWLRHITLLGPRIRLRGRPVVTAYGAIVIGDRVQLVSTVARLELAARAGGTLVIGERTLVNYGTAIVAEQSVTIGERCLIGPHCMIMDTAFHDVDPDRRLDPPAADPVSIGNNVWLGARVIVLPGVTIGDDAAIGVGSVVTKDVPPRTLAIGVPARIVRSL